MAAISSGSIDYQYSVFRAQVELTMLATLYGLHYAYQAEDHAMTMIFGSFQEDMWNGN